MLKICLLTLVGLFLCSTAISQNRQTHTLQILTQSDEGVQVERILDDGESKTFVLAGPEVEIVFPENSELVFQNLDGGAAAINIDDKTQVVSVHGNYSVEIISSGKVVSRVAAKDSVMSISTS